MAFKNKSIFTKLILSLSSFILAFVIAEFLAIYFLPKPKSVDVKNKIERNFTTKETQLYINSPGGRRLKPNVDLTIKNNFFSNQNINIKTNSLGFRDEEVSNSSQKILFLGDSITLQSYLNVKDTFVHILEKKLQGNNHLWEVINSGVDSIGLESELAILKENYHKINPQIVVLNFYLNDFYESHTIYMQDIPRIIRKSRLLYYLIFNFRRVFYPPPSPYHKDTKLWKENYINSNKLKKGDFVTSKEAFNDLIAEYFYDWGSAWSEDVWSNVLEPQIKEFKELSLELDFKPVIFVFPVTPQIDANYLYDFPQQMMKTIGKKLDIPVFDLLPVLKEHFHKNRQVIYYDGCHPSELGNQIIANEMHQRLTDSIIN